jgi:hypothetical protein
MLVSTVCAIYQENIRICMKQFDLFLMYKEEAFNVIIYIVSDMKDPFWGRKFVQECFKRGSSIQVFCRSSGSLIPDILIRNKCLWVLFSKIYQDLLWCGTRFRLDVLLLSGCTSAMNVVGTWIKRTTVAMLIIEDL